MSLENRVVLVFDIWGKFGHFKKFYTTSSPLTFSVPPPTAVFGMIGAVLGLDKEEYLKHINHQTTKIGIQILNPVKKTRISLNLIDTKNSNSFHLIKGRTQIKTEFLKDPAYRLYVNISDKKLFQNLIEKVKNKENYYTLSLGLANLLANFRFVGIWEAKPVKETYSVSTVIPVRHVKNIDIETGKRYFREKLPTGMLPDRTPLRYEDFIMEISGKQLNGKFENCCRLNGINVFIG